MIEREIRQNLLKQSKIQEHGCADPGIDSERQGLADFRILVCNCGEEATVTGMELAAA